MKPATTARTLTIPDLPPDGKGALRWVVSVGNTHARFGAFRGAALAWTDAIATADLLADPPAAPMGGPLALVSVVPAATERLVEAWGGDRLCVLTAEASGLAVHYDPPGSMGADRIANAIALLNRGLSSTIAVDCGTATTFTVVDAEGAVRGGAIAPGLDTSARALFAETAQLPEVPFALPSAPWGEDTLTNLQLGIVEGHVGMIRHLVSRFEWELGAATVVLCGGWSELLGQALPEYQVVRHLTLEGGRIFAEQRASGLQGI